MDTATLRLSVTDEIDGKPISPEYVPVGLLQEFARDVEQFLRGNDNTYPHEKLVVSVEPGSLALNPVGDVPYGVMKDIALLQVGNEVSKLDKRRAEVVLRWQKKASASRSLSYKLKGDTFSVTISRNTGYFAEVVERWVPVKRRILGEVKDLGGVRKANVHLRTDKGTIVIRTDQETLANDESNRLYKRVLVSISAEENLATGELRNARLLSFDNYAPTTESETTLRARDHALDAWSEVADAVEWVRRNREG